MLLPPRYASTRAWTCSARPRGFLATSEGIVLNGRALTELRAALSVLRSAAALADARPAGQVSSLQYAGRLTAVRAAAEKAAAAVERLLPGR